MTVQKVFDYKEILTKYAKFLDRNVSSNYWSKILWDDSAKKMLVRNGSITKYLMIEMYSSNILNDIDRKKMIERFNQLFGMKGKQDAEKQIQYVYSNLVDKTTK